MTFRCQWGDKLQGQLRVYPEDNLPDDLFRNCRQGGKRIEVTQMPRKRRRTRPGRWKSVKKKLSGE
jgi:hypothetical protein